ncbi:MAG TPA: DUF5719 family protein [Acidimicrobiia bacterium]
MSRLMGALTRMVGTAGVASVVVASILVSPDTPVVDDVALPAPAPASVAVCPIWVDRSTTGSVVLGSSKPFAARSSVYAAGRQISDGEVVVDATGGARLGFDQVVVSGLAGLLMEVPDLDTAVGVSVTGLGIAAANCTAPVSSTTVAAGVSTRSGERVELILVNPYAVDASVSVSSSSEAGLDSAGELETIVVPSASVVTRDLDALLPLRNRMAVTITASSGHVHGFLVQHGGTDRAMLEAVTPQASWFLPLAEPIEGSVEWVVVASTSSTDIPVRIDGLIDGAWVDGLWSTTIETRSQAEFDLGELDPRPSALRIGADGLIVPSLVVESETFRAATPAVPFPSTDWYITGGAGALEAVVSASGEFDSTVTFFPHEPGGRPIVVELPPGGSAVVELPAAGGGYAVRATSEVLVTWRASVEGGLALGAGVPVEGHGE